MDKFINQEDINRCLVMASQLSDTLPKVYNNVQEIQRLVPRFNEDPDLSRCGQQLSILMSSSPNDDKEKYLYFFKETMIDMLISLRHFSAHVTQKDCELSLSQLHQLSKMVKELMLILDKIIKITN